MGIFTIDGALKLSQLEELAAQGLLEEKVIPVEAMFTELPALTVKDAFARLIENGNAFYPGQAEENVRTPDGGQVRVYAVSYTHLAQGRRKAPQQPGEG